MGFDRIGINDDFFALGGHSLLASRVISRLRRIFNIEIPLRTIFEAPTVAELAKKIVTYTRQKKFVPRENLMQVERPAAIPLSFSQQSLWFLAQMETDSSTYNMSEIVRLKGKIEAEALRSALEKFIWRHEILRTSFVSIGGQPSQIVADETKADFIRRRPDRFVQSKRAKRKRSQNRF